MKKNVEIERKFLVPKALWAKVKKDVHWTDTLSQGYLSKAPSHNVRIRVGTIEAELTIKGRMVGITRPEFNYKIPLDDGKQLLQLCDKPLVKKHRHYIQVGKHLWIVDEFLGMNKGLLMAEVELKKETEKFVMPDWVDKEVTHDKRYTNTYIASHKVPVE